MSKILKLRRGTSSTMLGPKSNTVLAAGEIFAEVPNTGVGTGKGRLVMGDGTTTYGNLPSFIENTDVSTSAITITADSSQTSTAALNNVASNATTGALIGSLKQAISLTKSELTSTIDERLYSTGVNTGTPFYFDYQDGKYGYNTSSLRGADTFSPFNKELDISTAVDLTDSFTYNSTGRIYTSTNMSQYKCIAITIMYMTTTQSSASTNVTITQQTNCKAKISKQNGIFFSSTGATWIRSLIIINITGAIDVKWSGDTNAFNSGARHRTAVGVK